MRRSPIVDRIWDATIWPGLKRGLNAVHYGGVARDLASDEPLLLVANHVSWWDGFLLRELRRCLGRDASHYSVMLSRELQKHPVLGGIGAVGIEPGAAASLRALLRDLSAWREECPAMSVSFFPQGRIWPAHRRPLGFQRGVEGIARVLLPVTVLPVAIHVEPLTGSRPTAFVLAGEPVRVADPSDTEGLAASLEATIETLLDHTHDLLNQYGEASPEAWARENPASLAFHRG